MKTIYEKFDKTIIQKLPRVLFDGRIYTITTSDEADRAVSYLMQKKTLGFDTETRPSFRRGVIHQVALLQVADENTCFLFRLNRIGLTDSIVRLLEDRTITKIGLSLKDDIRMLQQRREFSTGTFIDLQQEVKEIGIADCSLQKLYANLLGGMICKRQQLSNWEDDILTEAQKLYAATDAWACVKLHKEVERLKATGNYLLIKDEGNTKEDENK